MRYRITTFQTEDVYVNIADPVSFVRSLRRPQAPWFLINAPLPWTKLGNRWHSLAQKVWKSKSCEQLEWLVVRFNECFTDYAWFPFQGWSWHELEPETFHGQEPWRHFLEKFLWAIPSLSLINSCCPFWRKLVSVEVRLMTISWYGS